MAFQYAGADPAVPRGKYFTIVYFSVGNQTYPGREHFLAPISCVWQIAIPDTAYYISNIM